MRSLALPLVLLVAASGAAQDDPAADLLPEGMPDDPIGTGDTGTLRDVPSEPEEPPVDPMQPPRAPDIDRTEGRVVTAIPGIREVDHEVDLKLSGGLLEARVVMRFISRADHRGEVRYRLPVPEGARPGSLEVCIEERCRRAAPDDSSAYDDAVRTRPVTEDDHVVPVAAVRVDETDGTALVIHAAPVIGGETLELRLSWFAETETHGGITHVRLPARGRDPRAAPARLTFETDELLAPAVDGRPAYDRRTGHHEIEPWESVTVSATHRSGGAQVELSRFACGSERCARLHAVAGPRGARRERVVLLLDASPSMIGPARGRLGVALAALLGTMHRNTEVQALAFAGQAQPLLAEWRAPDEVPLATLGRTSALDLGSATRFEVAWEAVQPRRGYHLIVVGDGGLTESRAGLAAAQAARAAGVRVSVLNLAGRPTKDALRSLAESTGGMVVQAGAEAHLASRARTSERLEEKVAVLSASTVANAVRVERPGLPAIDLGSLRAGEALHWSGLAPRGSRFVVGEARRPARGPRADSPLGRALAAMARPAVSGRLAAVAAEDRRRPSLCAGEGPATRASGVSLDADPVVLAETRSCAPPSAPAPNESRALGRGMPAETVLSMLRRRIIPGARRCFRVDRAGRGDYSVRAVFELELADREVSSAEVEGEISERLRSCLMATLEGLDVPIFRGSVLVRYPLYTERQPPAPTIELREEVAEPVDRLLGEDAGRAPPDPPL